MNRWALILAAVFLAGCARFEPQPISPAKTAADLESRSLTNAALKIFLEKNLHRELNGWPAVAWDFDMLADAAFFYHPDLAVARAQWHLAQAGVQTAGGRPNPSLSLVPGYDTTHSPLSPWFPAVSFDVPIETAGKRGHRIAAAEQLSESARLNIATVAWQVRSRLRSSLLDLAASKQRAALLQDQVSLQERVVKLLEQQAQAGAIAGAEASTSRIALHKLRLDLADAWRQQAEARARVAEAIGVPVAALGVPPSGASAARPPENGTPSGSELELSFDPLKAPVAAGDLTSAAVRRAALQSRTDILGALAEYAAAQSTLQLEIAKQYPDVHLSPGYQYDQGDNKWSLGITFELPVLNQNQGPIAEAGARREESAARFNALQARVLAEIERAVQVFRASEKDLDLLGSLAAAQAQQRDAAEAQAKAGAAGRLESVSARSEFVSAQLLQLDGQFKFQQAAGALEDAVQRPVNLPDLLPPPARPAPAKSAARDNL